MKKALIVGDHFEAVEVMTKYKNVLDFLPVASVSAGLNNTVSINALNQHVDLPALKALELKDFLKAFDVVICAGNVPEQIDSYVDPTKLYSLNDAKPVGSYIAKKTVKITLAKPWDFENNLTLVYYLTQELRSMGIRVNVSTDVASLKGYTDFVSCQDQPDFVLHFTAVPRNSDYSFSMAAKNFYDAANAIREKLVATFTTLIPKTDYIARELKLFAEKDFCNFYVFSTGKGKGTYLFHTCTRQSERMQPKLALMVNNFFIGNATSLETASYHELMNFSKTRFYERMKAERFATLFTFKFVKIENINDVILSYLGARKCNMNCAYCFSDHEQVELPPITRSEVRKAADYILKGNQDINLHVDNYIGGEPCIDFEEVRRMYEDLFSYHKTFGINASFGYLTNAMALTEEQLQWLRKNVPYIGFSLDGDKKTNDAVRCNKAGVGSYDAVVKALELMKKLKWPVQTGISCVLTANNVKVKEIFLHFVDTMGIPNVTIKPVRAPETSPIALTTKNIAGLKEGYRELFEFVYTKMKAGDTSYIKAMLVPLDYAGRFFIRVFLKDRVVAKRCGSAEHIFSIGNDACGYACDSFNGTDRGFLFDMRGDNFESDYRVPFVTEANKFSCEKCWARHLCGGICQYVQYVNGYEKNSVTEFECEFARFLIEEAIKFWARAEEELPAATLAEIKNHIIAIGFREYANKDSFFYAPC